ncbi:MAG: hypothetical protein JWQ38_1361 [Flavipsychrobacter sp.]|nr:hypothetical protein [Flavipsychrobacter sp.]
MSESQICRISGITRIFLVPALNVLAKIIAHIEIDCQGVSVILPKIVAPAYAVGQALFCSRTALLIAGLLPLFSCGLCLPVASKSIVSLLFFCLSKRKVTKEKDPQSPIAPRDFGLALRG